MNDHSSRRARLRVLLGLITALVAAMRFSCLRADFPNGTMWAADQAKFTDEGWWTQAAVMHRLLGHWYLPGDYNPGVALPAWPLLTGVVFHFTGVNLVAARALAVTLSLGAVVLVYWLVRRETQKVVTLRGTLVPEITALLLTANAFAFVFCRLAILDALVVFGFCLALLLASLGGERRLLVLGTMPLLLTAMLLTKTTAAVLFPAVFWLLWRRLSETWPRALWEALAVTLAAPLALVEGYYALARHAGYGDALSYFFSVNALEDLSLRASFAAVPRVLLDALWIDRVLYPAALAALVVSVVWLRKLWRQPLFAACWIALVCSLAYLVRRPDDYAPRYLLVAVVPVAVMVAWTAAAVAVRSRAAGGAAYAVIAAAVVLNAVAIVGFLRHRTYDFVAAADDMAHIVRSDPQQPEMLLGICASQISLMTGLPSINDAYGTEPLAEKIARYQPGWYVAWNGVGPDEAAALRGYRLVEVAHYDHVFDDDDRKVLLLYRMEPRR